jgi:hypothetical protein
LKEKAEKSRAQKIHLLKTKMRAIIQGKRPESRSTKNGKIILTNIILKKPTNSENSNLVLALDFFVSTKFETAICQRWSSCIKKLLISFNFNFSHELNCSGKVSSTFSLLNILLKTFAKHFISK